MFKGIGEVNWPADSLQQISWTSCHQAICNCTTAWLLQCWRNAEGIVKNVWRQTSPYR